MKASFSVLAFLFSLVIFNVLVRFAAVFTRDRLKLVAIVDLEARIVVKFESVLLVLVHLVNLDHAYLVHHNFALDSAIRKFVDLVLVLRRRRCILIASDTFVVLVKVVSVVKVRVVDLLVGLAETDNRWKQAIAVILSQLLRFFLRCGDLAKLAFKRIDRIRMPG